MSLTTYGRRTSYVHLAIESIARGAVRPSKIILWLDEPEALAKPPRALARLAKRGLQILPCHNYGPHKKYYPYVESLDPAEPVDPLVIVDDDFIYPVSWLSSLLTSYEEYPEAVSCTRAHVIQVAEVPKPYSEWPACDSDLPSARTFATGVGGVLYPPKVQFEMKSFGRLFESCAPRADDIWLHYVTVASGNAVRQVKSKSLDLEFKILPFGQDTSLQMSNVGMGANDEQVLRTYDDETLNILRGSDRR